MDFHSRSKGRKGRRCRRCRIKGQSECRKFMYRCVVIIDSGHYGHSSILCLILFGWMTPGGCKVTGIRREQIKKRRPEGPRRAVQAKLLGAWMICWMICGPIGKSGKSQLLNSLRNENGGARLHVTSRHGQHGLGLEEIYCWNRLFVFDFKKKNLSTALSERILHF